MSGAYARAGVDEPATYLFKQTMLEVCNKTRMFPLWHRDVHVTEDDSLEYRPKPNGDGRQEMPPLWSFPVIEVLGNQSWIAEWMYRETKDPCYLESSPSGAAMMAVVDVIRRGHLPVICMDAVVADRSEWYKDEARRAAIARGFYGTCRLSRMALGGGESATLKYLARSAYPLEGAAIFLASVTGIMLPEYRRQYPCRQKPRAGDAIIGVTSSGVHTNGISLIISKVTERLPKKFLHELPGGITVGQEVLTPTRCYVRLVEEFLRTGAWADVRAVVPGTGGGVAKLASAGPFTFRIEQWVPVMPIFQFFRHELGIPLFDCLRTFNWGVGLYLIVAPGSVERIIRSGDDVGYQIDQLGTVEEGERRVVFGPEGDLILPPQEV